jgi:hypothetical protein
MVPLRTVPNSFHARVLAARLGAAGILTQLKGAIDGPYPIGNVVVLVGEEDLDDARELLLADEVEAVFEDISVDDEPADDGSFLARPVWARPAWASWLSLALLIAMGAGLFARML